MWIFSVLRRFPTDWGSDIRKCYFGIIIVQPIRALRGTVKLIYVHVTRMLCTKKLKPEKMKILNDLFLVAEAETSEEILCT